MAELSQRVMPSTPQQCPWPKGESFYPQHAQTKINTGATTMSKLRTLNLTLIDNHPDLKGKEKIVFQTLNYVTEHNDDQTKQQILMSGDVAKALKAHNKNRVCVVDRAILRNTGRDVFLEEVEIFDLEWQVIQVA